MTASPTEQAAEIAARLEVTAATAYVADEQTIDDMRWLLSRVEELQAQLDAARSTAAIDALTTARRAISDHRIGLGRNRSRLDVRFQGRLLGLEEAGGRLTALIKSLRANQPGGPSNGS